MIDYNNIQKAAEAATIPLVSAQRFFKELQNQLAQPEVYKNEVIRIAITLNPHAFNFAQPIGEPDTVEARVQKKADRVLAYIRAANALEAIFGLDQRLLMQCSLMEKASFQDIMGGLA